MSQFAKKDKVRLKAPKKDTPDSDPDRVMEVMEVSGGKVLCSWSGGFHAAAGVATFDESMLEPVQSMKWEAEGGP